MIYREAGQFKTTYQTDSAIFPILQDKLFMLALLAISFAVIPVLGSDYLLSGILIPFLILALAALGLNILTGYAGQLSLGSAAFMAVGAFATFNFITRIPGMPLLLALVLGGLTAAVVGILFGLPSLRIKGFYLAVATLAAQFFIAGAGTLSFAVLFGCPRKSLPFCGLVGAVGWFVYELAVMLGADSAAASLLAVIPLTLLTRVFAIVIKMPVTVFLLSGIFPLVPGAGIYYTAYYFIQGNNALALSNGISTFKVAVALAVGISLVLSVPIPKKRRN